MLNQRDLLILKTLEKTTLATNYQLMILCGYRGDPSVPRKKLKSLIEQGYVTSEWFGERKAYTLTQKGLSEIEKTRHPYEIRGIKSEHEYITTMAACLIYQKTGRSIHDMVFDHEMASLSAFRGAGHRPDIVYSPHNCVEVELTPKRLYGTSDKSGLDDNFRSNCENYNRQIWIVPAHKHALMNNLKKLSETYGVADRVNILTVDKLLEEVKGFDLKDNAPRLEPVRGLPTPRANKEGGHVR